jgi:hypothetical protein
MSTATIPFISGFFGALIGSITSVLVVFIQTRSQRKTQLSSLAVQAAIADQKCATDIVGKSRGGGSVLPLSVYIHSHLWLLEELDKRTLTPRRYLAHMKEQETFENEVRRISKELEEGTIETRQ